MVPKKIFLTRGCGKHQNELQSFELALQSAGIEKCNLVNVSSVIPPGCKLVDKEKGVQQLQPGQITYCVMAKKSTTDPNKMISAAVGTAIPLQEESHGYISETRGFIEREDKAKKHAEKLAENMLATRLRAETKKMKQPQPLKKIKSRVESIAQIEKSGPEGVWTTVIAAAVFLEK